MFLGEYQRTIDNKGRLFVPTKFRDNLSEGIAIISKGFSQKCLFLFSKEGWDIFEASVSSLRLSDKDAQMAARWFFSSASEENLDQQGRIKIQQNLLESAGLKKEVIVIGLSKRAEIWDREAWENYYDEANKAVLLDNSIFEKLGI